MPRREALSSHGASDLEALKHGEDLVVYLEPFTRRLPSEVAE
jgi:hypothetical protein